MLVALQSSFSSENNNALFVYLTFSFVYENTMGMKAVMLSPDPHVIYSYRNFLFVIPPLQVFTTPGSGTTLVVFH